jgi:gamma-glutamyltranspeptidase / glutathione hydrolase
MTSVPSMPFETPLTHRGLVVARRGAIATSQPLATSAGLAILERGGTFADAAIAASAVLCVVEPWNSHLGGDAFLIVHDAQKRENVAFNGSGEAPAHATRESYKNGIAERGIRASTVPGLVSTWFALHEKFGKLPVRDVLQTAIGYARDGFPVGVRWVKKFAEHANLIAEFPELVTLGTGADARLGQIVTQSDLAWTLEQIATHGRAAFYHGAVAEKIVAAGHFSLSDLDYHQTRLLPPLTVNYRGVSVHCQPPPSQGMVLAQELGIINHVDRINFTAMDEAARIHVLVEAKKLAFADRNQYLADPETNPVPIEQLLNAAYLARRWEQIGDTASTHPAGQVVSEGNDTTYFLVADADGNAVSFIQSIFNNFGCATIIPGTGILLNNRMTGFVLDADSPNCLAPSKRPAHTLNAWLATDAEGKLAHVGGTPGGHIQVQTNLQLLVNVIDGGMNPQEAIEAPRWQHLGSGGAVATIEEGVGTLEIETRGRQELVDALSQRGHAVKTIGDWAHGSAAQLLSLLPDGAYAVGSDPRCDGHAAGR